MKFSIFLKGSLIQANKLMIPLQNHGDDGPVLSIAPEYQCGAIYHLNVGNNFLCNWVKRMQPSELIYLTSRLLMPAIVMSRAR